MNYNDWTKKMETESRGGSGKKLTADEVRSIRTIYEDDNTMSCRNLAKLYGVSAVTISNIIQRKFYKWVK